MKKLTLTRTFQAPIDEVWRAWTDAELLKEWWAPAGMHCSHVTADVHEEGRFLYCFKKDDDDTEYWGRGIYQTITEPTFLSYLDSFTDKKGNDVPPSHYGMPGDEVVESLTEITLKEDKNGTHVILAADNPFGAQMTKEMTKSWNEMFDKLAGVLKHNGEL
jgi:uncharacterized protein YndB with AHSA1/START domain